MIARDFTPALYENHKILPSDIMGGGMGSMFGNTYFCIKSTDSRYGQFKNDYDTVYPNGNHAVQTSLTACLALLGPYDTIYLCPGNWSGNYTTPLNAIAPFCSLIGIDPTGRGVGPWMAPAAGSESSPIIDVWARGWRISGIEFEGMTGAAAIRLVKIAGLTKRGPDFITIDHCLFSGGKTGIEFAGGGTYWKISDNQFSLLTTAGGAAIYCNDSGFQIPALGLIENNRFDNGINHIYSIKGFNDVTIRGNVFQQDGNGQNATILLDINGGGGGCMIVGNYFDCTAAEYASSAYIECQATDFGAGNFCNDGVPGYAGSAQIIDGSS